VRTNAFQKRISLVYVAFLSRTPAMVMQADRALPETLARKLGLGGMDAEAASTAQAGC
jgi:hypothetical protein